MIARHTVSNTRSTVGVIVEALLILAIAGASLVGAALLQGGAPGGANPVSAANIRAVDNSIVVVNSASAALAETSPSSVVTYSIMGRDYFLVFVRAQCWSGDQKLFESWINIKTGDTTTGGYATFEIPSSSWEGLAACNADLINAYWKGKTRVYETLATTTFTAGG
jgi:hypothetical protein